MSYDPQPGSKAEAAIKYIAKNGSGRSADIALAIGIEAKNIPGTLASAVANGALVACDIEIPGKQRQKEYRIGGMAPTAFNRPDFTINPRKLPPSGSLTRPAAASVQPQPQATPRDSRNAELAKSLQVTHAVAARRSGGRQRSGVIRDQILSALEASTTCLTAVQIAEKSGLKCAKVTNAMTKIVKSGVVDHVKSGGTRAYFLVANPAPASEHTPTPKSQHPAAKVQRKTAKTATAKPGKNIPQIIPVALPPTPIGNFRCGIFSDGALRLDGDFPIDQGGVVINRAQTVILVDYLRKLGDLEFA